MLEHTQGLLDHSRFWFQPKHAAPWIVAGVLWMAAWIFFLYETGKSKEDGADE